MIFHVHRKLRVHLKYLLAGYNSVFKSLGYNQRQLNILNILVLKCRTTSKNETLGFNLTIEVKFVLGIFVYNNASSSIHKQLPSPCSLPCEVLNPLQIVCNGPFRAWCLFLLESRQTCRWACLRPWAKQTCASEWQCGLPHSLHPIPNLPWASPSHQSRRRGT